MSRATISVERVDFDPADQTVTVHEKQEQPFSETESYPIMDFLALLACHIPSTYESLVYYYGIYSSSYRGKEKKEETKAELEQVEEEGKKEPINGKVSSS